METDNMNYALQIFLAFCLMYLWLVIPENKWFRPFPFYKAMEITQQTYADYLCVRVVLLWLVYLLVHAGKLPGVYLPLFFLFIVDYMLIFNQPFGYFKSGFTRVKPEGMSIPLSYSLIMGIVLSVLAGIKTIWK